MMALMTDGRINLLKHYSFHQMGYVIADFPHKIKEHDCMLYIDIIQNWMHLVQNFKVTFDEIHMHDGTKELFQFERDLREGEVPAGDGFLLKINTADNTPVWLPSNRQISMKFAEFRHFIAKNLWFEQVIKYSYIFSFNDVEIFNVLFV